MDTVRLARRLLVLLPVLGCALFAGVAMIAGAPTTAFELVFEGRHVPATIPTASGVMHVGTFTASTPFCASGTVVDLEFIGSNAVRRSYTCGDGSGSMTMRVTTPVLEHVTGAGAAWTILGGTGKYVSLRGKGRYSSVQTGGDQADFASITFRSTSTGIADLDADAPQIVIASARATKLRRPAGMYLVTAKFSARDNVAANVVSYQLALRAGSADLAFRSGRTTQGNRDARNARASAQARPEHPDRDPRFRPARQRTDTGAIAQASALRRESRPEHTQSAAHRRFASASGLLLISTR